MNADHNRKLLACLDLRWCRNDKIQAFKLVKLVWFVNIDGFNLFFRETIKNVFNPERDTCLWTGWSEPQLSAIIGTQKNLIP